MNILRAMFGNYSEKEIKRIKPIQARVLSLEEEYRQLSDDELRHKTTEFKERLSAGETLDDILPEAFAACREAGDRESVTYYSKEATETAYRGLFCQAVVIKEK